MKRVLFDSEIRQQSKSGFFCANDLITAGNQFRVMNKLPIIKLNDWINKDVTREFINELESQLGIKVKKATRGRNGVTWVHPYLFIDLALTISPKLKIEVYSWLFDELIKYRNESGDSYKKMTGALYENTKNKSLFTKGIQNTARLIKSACQVKDWESASQEQLKLRDRMHDNIALLCDILKDNNQAIKLGILKTLENK